MPVSIVSRNSVARVCVCVCVCVGGAHTYKHMTDLGYLCDGGGGGGGGVYIHTNTRQMSRSYFYLYGKGRSTYMQTHDRFFWVRT